jgi:hypothetical protein
MKTDAEVLREKDDVEFLKRPNLWPRWPLLPLKKVIIHSLDTAVAVEAPDGMVWLYTGDTANIYMFNPKGPRELLSPEEIVARGWKVD